jgi:hypothetical protein
MWASMMKGSSAGLTYYFYSRMLLKSRYTNSSQLSGLCMAPTLLCTHSECVHKHISLTTSISGSPTRANG